MNSHQLYWRPRSEEIPQSPGVYRFFAPDKRILYVGKAINLRNRLANYFQDPDNLPERTRHMVLAANGVDWTVVASDVQALQLEYTWIKEYAPPYNIRFRDDKSYPYLVVTLADEAPRVMVTRNRHIPGARYFGPYPKVWAVRETIEWMVKAFPIRTCTPANYKRAMQTGRPCFLGQIGRCGGPCSGRVNVAEHREMVKDFVAFMESHDSHLITNLREEMRLAADSLEYERAAKLRDRIQALENVLERSAVVLNDVVDTDVFGLEQDQLAAAVHQFVVRGARVRGVHSWVVDKELEITDGELIRSVLETVYESRTPPKEIVVPYLPEDAEALALWLSERREKGKVSFGIGRRGDKSALLKTATMNAKETLNRYKLRRTADYLARSRALSELQEALALPEAPLRMECYDVSHLGGTGVVASMVVFEDGLAKKSAYRKFTVQDTTDDTASLAQVIRRRMARLDEPKKSGLENSDNHVKRFAYHPGLIIVDGGQPQVQAVAKVLQETGVSVPLVGIAKRLEELWLPGEDFPVILPRGSEALFLVQRIRDEAHRFAITFQRQKRNATIATVLADIPGLGQVRSRELLRHFGSVARLRAADAASIAKVPGIGPVLAETIVARLGG